MDGPGPRAALRNLAAALLLVIQLTLAYTDMPPELMAAIAGVYMAALGTGEALWDAKHKAP